MFYSKMKIRVFEVFLMCFFLRMDQTLYFRFILLIGECVCNFYFFLVYSFIRFNPVIKSKASLSQLSAPYLNVFSVSITL